MDYSYFVNYKIDDPVTAAVGENGHPTIDYYAEGYFESVRLMINEILRRLNLMKSSKSHQIDIKNIKITEDILVYPICFNIRHSIELYLKAIIEKIISIYEIKNLRKPSSLNISHHNIILLWELISTHNFSIWSMDSYINRKQIFDEKFDAYLSILNEYIQQWGAIDPTGQTFRYPLDTESKRHLQDISNIQILFLFSNAEKNHKKLDDFYHFIQNLHDDYKKNRGNQFLTYFQLTKLAESLPVFHQWGEALTQELLDELQIKFKLVSRRQIYKCIDYIKQDYYLSSLISKDIAFKFLSNDKVKDIIDFFKQFQIKEGSILGDNKSERNLSLNTIDWEAWQQERERIQDFFSDYTYNELVDLVTIIYIGRDENTPQEYDLIYRYMEGIFETPDSIINKIQEKQCNIVCYLNNSLDIFGKSFLRTN